MINEYQLAAHWFISKSITKEWPTKSQNQILQISESDPSDLQPNHKQPGEAKESQTETIKKLRSHPSDDEVRSEVSDRKEEKTKKELIVEADAAEDKGFRHTMEDSWVVLYDACLDFPGNLRYAHFVVYDGHGGRLTAEYAKKYLHANVVSAGLPRELIDVKAAKKAILDGFRKTDASLLQESALGGSVSSNGRLQGRLDVSRAFGDRQFKKVGVVATPDIHSFDITKREHFIILGFDGLWGVFGPSDAVDFVNKLLKEGLTVATVSRRLVKEAVHERGCKDNCTTIVIVFRHK